MSYERLKIPEEQVPSFIEAVKQRECLWNPKDKQSKVRFVIWTAWKEVAEQFNCPVENVKMKWKNLRDIFMRELKKYKGKDRYEGRWRYFEKLFFLIDPESLEENGYNSNNNRDESEGLEENEDASDDQITEEYLVPVTDRRTKIKQEVESVYFEDSRGESPPPETNINPAKKRKREEEDYDMMYLKSLLPYFQKLEPMRNLIVRSKIHDILLKELAAQNSGKTG